MNRRPFPFAPSMRYGLLDGLLGAPCARPEHHGYMVSFRMGRDYPETANSWAQDIVRSAPCPSAT